MKLLLYYIDKKQLIKMFTLISIQQIVAAVGTFALAQAGLSFDNHFSFSMWVILSLFLYLISPIFSIPIRRYESELGLKAYSVFLRDNLFSKAGVTSFWQNKIEKDRFLASIGSDANDYLALLLLVTMDIFSFSLSLVLGVFVLGISIDIKFIPAFIFSGILSYFAYFFLSNKVQDKYQREQSNRTNLFGHLFGCWDNLFLNNEGVKSYFFEQFRSKMNKTLEASLTSATWAEGLIFLLGILSGLPVLWVVGAILLQANVENQKNILIALLATLPRQLQFLGYYRNIFQSLTNLIGIHAKFNVLQSGAILSDRDLISSINASQISMNKIPIENINALVIAISTSKAGRFEITGPNGSGKSTLLLHLNRILPSSFYLPSYPSLSFDSQPTNAGSTGENLLRHFEYLCSLNEQVILLDEWDANLDQNNKLIIEQKIQILSQTKTVLEVRHRN